MDSIHKRCKECQQWLPATLEYFPQHGKGLRTRCKPCERAYQRSRYTRKKPPRPSVPPGFRYCSHCQQTKPATSEFFSEQNGKLRWYCRPCCVAIARENVLKRHPPQPKPVIPPGFRVCAACTEMKPLTSEFFSRNKRFQSGLNYTCKECQNKNHKSRYPTQREKIIEKSKHYRSEHREKRIAYEKHYNQVNAHKRLAHQRMYAQTEKGRASRRISKRNRIAYEKGAPGRFTQQDILLQLQRQKYLCYYCHQDVSKNYHIDHVIPLSRGGTNWPDNLVIACPTCNMRKNKKLPHEFFEGGRLL